MIKIINYSIDNLNKCCICIYYYLVSFKFLKCKKEYFYE